MSEAEQGACVESQTAVSFAPAAPAAAAPAAPAALVMMLPHAAICRLDGGGRVAAAERQRSCPPKSLPRCPGRLCAFPLLLQTLLGTADDAQAAAWAAHTCWGGWVAVGAPPAQAPLLQPTFCTVAVLAPAPFSPADSATTRRWDRGRATVGTGALRAWETVQACILAIEWQWKGRATAQGRCIIADRGVLCVLAGSDRMNGAPIG